MRTVQLKPVWGLFWVKEHRSLRTIPMDLQVDIPLGVPANGSLPQRTPGAATELLHHCDPAEHMNMFHLNNCHISIGRDH
jgi:hypothetical protein